MQLTRYYKKKQIEGGHIRGIRDLLSNSFDWSFARANYSLYYPPSQHYSIDAIKEVDAVIAKHGQPTDVFLMFTSQGGRICNIETRVKDRISVQVDNKGDAPEKVLDALEPVLSLELLGELTTGQQISSAFVAHGFTDEGTTYANELARFLALLGIRCYSGRSFSTGRLSDKVSIRLGKHDAFFAIVTPQEDHTWITQEIATAAALKKPLFILKRLGVTLKEGILGDQEFIAFPEGHLSKAFIPILEGLSELRGLEVPVEPYPELPA